MATAVGTSMAAALEYRGLLKGHNGWVTSIATTLNLGGSELVASSSRDGTVIVWGLTADQGDGLAGVPLKSLHKHKQPVSEAVLSTTGEYLLSCSWDKTMLLWDVNAGEAFRTFKGHTGDVTGCAMSSDNRQIISCSRDKTIRLWNTLAQHKCALTENQHTDWISGIRYSPDTPRAQVVSCGWDKLAKVWELEYGRLVYDFVGHTAPVKSVAISPDGSLCASGGADGWAMLWDVVDGNHLYSLESQSAISSLCFSPCNYWLCAATETGIKIWDLENKKLLSDVRMSAPKDTGNDQRAILSEHKRLVQRQPTHMATLENHPRPSQHLPWCSSLNWSPDGETLYAGSSNGNIYVFGLRKGRM